MKLFLIAWYHSAVAQPYAHPINHFAGLHPIRVSVRLYWKLVMLACVRLK